MPKTSLKSIIFSWLENLLTMICFETYPLIDRINFLREKPWGLGCVGLCMAV